MRYNVHRGTTAGFTPSTANRIAQPDRDELHRHGSRPARTTTRSRPRTRPATSARPRTRRPRRRRYERSKRARNADRNRCDRSGHAELGRRDRQRRRPALQPPPRDHRRLHARDREPDRAADRHELHRHGRCRHLLLQGHGRGRRRQRRCVLERGERDGDDGHDGAERAFGPDGSGRGSTVNLSWTASTDNVGVARYNVHRGTTAGFTPSTANRIAQPTGTTHTDSGLAIGTYYYKVTAEDAAGNISGASNEISATVADASAPTAPTGLTAGAVGSTINLAWTAATDNVGVVRYNVHRGTTSGFTPSTANRLPNRPARATRTGASRRAPTSTRSPPKTPRATSAPSRTPPARPLPTRSHRPPPRVSRRPAEQARLRSTGRRQPTTSA